ncbi:hypothetical protein SAMN04488005_1875 [Yoonia tamlensis]|uniref:DUF4177 domain-containing protein n=1 Tax=Yoonia tamlensis TaxID=390270 RepID=A0A1I6GLV8_9RHOB|nr:hypothetical protein [Yoonia tamlensis]SFR43205.1 hypothetical protein SAMN04488005_1875 [Yoonia tamlensis]
MSYEYMVVPAPTRGIKAKGAKTAQERFAIALETKMNTMANNGWDYVRTDTLPSEQREGLMSKTTVYQNMMVFRRAKKAPRKVAPTPAPVVAAPPAPPRPAPSVRPASEPPKVTAKSEDDAEA